MTQYFVLRDRRIPMALIEGSQMQEIASGKRIQTGYIHKAELGCLTLVRGCGGFWSWHGYAYIINSLEQQKVMQGFATTNFADIFIAVEPHLPVIGLVNKHLLTGEFRLAYDTTADGQTIRVYHSPSAFISALWLQHFYLAFGYKYY